MTARRFAGGFAALVMVAAFGLTGCKPDNTPKEYGILTQQNFLELCTNRYFTNTDDSLAITSSSIASDIDSPTQDQCQCQYDVFESQMPISDFTSLNAELKKDPQKGWDSVPESITSAITACMNGSSASTTTTVEDSTTTSTAS